MCQRESGPIPLPTPGAELFSRECRAQPYYGAENRGNPMPSTVTYEVHIDLPRAKVWEGLRDLSRAPRYVPNLTGVELTTDQREGVGASRRVFQVKGKPLDETVEEWEDGFGFKLRLHNGDKPPAPFPEAWFDYRIADAPDGGTLFRPAACQIGRAHVRNP